jgi:uncharacterized protein YjaZ
MLKSFVGLLFILILSTGCSNEERIEVISDDYDINYEITFLDEYMKNYIDELGKESASGETVFEEFVIKPIQSNYSVNFKTLFLREIKNLKELKKEIDLLEKEKESINKIIKDTLESCNSKLPNNQKLSIYILPEDPDIFERFKVDARGENPNSNAILLIVNPLSTNYKQSLARTLAHEYYHSVNKQVVKNEKKDLLTGLISEGKAENFASIVFPKVTSHFAGKLSKDDEYKLWKEINSKLSSEDVDVKSAILNGNKGDFPQLGGYTIGYNIVKEYIKKNPNVSIQEWTSMKAADILEKSGYATKWKY